MQYVESQLEIIDRLQKTPVSRRAYVKILAATKKYQNTMNQWV